MRKKIICFIVAMIMLNSYLFNGDIVVSAEPYYDAKVTDKLKVVIDENESDEYIPVCIWYKDIDHQLVENEIENTTGVSKKELDTEFDMPSNDILESIASLNSGEQIIESMPVSEYVKKYLETTKEQRNNERELVELYTDAKRKIKKKHISKKSEDIIESTGINYSNILFKSKYSPFMIVKCTDDEIKNLAINNQIIEIEYHDPKKYEVEPPSIWTLKASSGFSLSYSKTGLTGEGVELGVIDHGFPEYEKGIVQERIEVVGENTIPDNPVSDHGNNTLQVIFGDNGLAPNVSKIYYASLDDAGYPENTSFYYGIENLITAGVNVINGSIDIYNRFNYYIIDGVPLESTLYTTYEKWMDYMIYAYDITYLQATGNHENKTDLDDNYKVIKNLGLCYNSIAVGAVYDNETTAEEDDEVASSSAYRSFLEVNGERKYGCLKPDIVAPSNGWGGGTSTATPVVTSIIALMLELKPSLETQPQVIKAILLASCHRKAKDPVTGQQEEEMIEGLTLKQGAGVVDCYTALCIVGNAQYGERSIESYMDKDNVTIIQPKYLNHNINFSIAWFNQGNIVLDSSYINPVVGKGYIQDLDLVVYRVEPDGDKICVGYSDEENSSTEMTYLPFEESNNKFKVEVEKFFANEYQVTYGYAWSTDMMAYNDLGNEGLFLLKNKRSRLYLNVDDTGMLYQSSSFNSATNQWVVKQKDNGDYIIYNGGYSGAVGEGILINDEIYEAKMINSENINLTLEENSNGTFSIKRLFGGLATGKYLQINNGSYIPETTACWGDLSLIDSAEWYLERINYEKGDLNMDGIIDSDDGYIIVEHFMYGEPISQVEKYLGDLNEDGVVDTKDLSLLMENVE